MQRNTDTVPAMLTPGEFVIRKDAAEQIGPEKLQMLNNIDRLSNSALLENARTPVAMQVGGEVRDSGFFGLFKDKVGGFLEQQGKNWERAAMMEEETGTRNPFLKTAEEQRALQRHHGLVPGGEITPPAPPQRPDVPTEEGRYPIEMLGDEEEPVYNPLTGNFMDSSNMSETDKVYYKTLPGLEKLTQKYDRYSESLEKLKKIEHLSNLARDAGRPEQLGVRARGWDPSLGELEEVALVNPGRPTVRPDRESVEMLPDEKISPEFDNEMFKMSHGMEDRYDFSPWESPPPMPEDERGGF